MPAIFIFMVLSCGHREFGLIGRVVTWTPWCLPFLKASNIDPTSHDRVTHADSNLTGSTIGTLKA